MNDVINRRAALVLAKLQGLYPESQIPSYYYECDDDKVIFFKNGKEIFTIFFQKQNNGKIVAGCPWCLVLTANDNDTVGYVSFNPEKILEFLVPFSKTLQ